MNKKVKEKYSILKILKQCHMQRLNNILTSNHLKHIPIEASGNYFIDAIACQKCDETLFAGKLYIFMLCWGGGGGVVCIWMWNVAIVG